MTALLCIDTAKNRVRRYEARRIGGRPLITEDVRIVRPQCHTLDQQLNDLLAGHSIEFVEDVPDLEPPAAA